MTLNQRQPCFGAHSKIRDIFISLTGSDCIFQVLHHGMPCWCRAFLDNQGYIGAYQMLHQELRCCRAHLQIPGGQCCFMQILHQGQPCCSIANGGQCCIMQILHQGLEGVSLFQMLCCGTLLEIIGYNGAFQMLHPRHLENLGGQCCIMQMLHHILSFCSRGHLGNLGGVCLFQMLHSGLPCCCRALLEILEPLVASQVRIPNNILPYLTEESEANIIVPIINNRKVKYNELHVDFTCPDISLEKALECVEEYMLQENLNFHNALVILQPSAPKDVRKDVRREVILERIQKSTDEELKYVVLKSKDTPVFLSGILARNEAHNDSLNNEAQSVYIFCCNHTRSLIQPLLNPKWFFIVPWNDVSENIHCSAFHQALIPSIETRTMQDIVVMLSRDEIVIVFDGDNVGNQFKNYISENPTSQIVVFCNQISYDNQIRGIIDDYHDNVVPFKSHTLENAADCDIIKFVCYLVNYCQHQNRKIDITIFSKDKIFKKMLKEKRNSQLLLPENSNSVIKILTE